MIDKLRYIAYTSSLTYCICGTFDEMTLLPRHESRRDAETIASDVVRLFVRVFCVFDSWTRAYMSNHRTVCRSVFVYIMRHSSAILASW